MSMNPNALLLEQTKMVVGIAPITPAGAAARRVTLKGCERCTVVIVLNNATTVTGSAITLKQAQDVSGTAEKALNFTQAWRNLDCAAGDALANFAVAGNTFTTDSTNSKQLMYVIEVNDTDLDVNNGFDCFRVDAAAGTATTLSAVYHLWPQNYGRATPPSAIVD